ncbi:DUF4157 domain-containing protein [Haloarcula sp. S1CR25-12]|uniref:DUF4157 domain-containing protein n=1 Tax=Haloarcula saliterrae TaxID=2950534 RepID=A0ABU2FFE8_9EURY|nr:DUF4157 domain-containing protein [Haloarcula sp. S1CR25-12]MDS0260521.1 DUF4157 domain-containing protein [Haloarcula sp. S1CR25-12]
MSFRSVSEAREKAGSAAMDPLEDDGDQRRSAGRDSGEGQQFGVEPYRDGHETVLQRLAQQHGTDQVRQWAAEGMPIETMGKTRDMADFRERQAERPPEVPKDIERQNAKSVQRSHNAYRNDSKAGDTQVPESVRSVISSSGQQLDASIQRAMEDRMGDSLGDVRVHTGPSAAKACDDINARAFTVGNHIAFNRGEYDPSSKEGQHVLAHELAHVRQQTGGAVSMLPQEGELAIDPDERLEREAEQTAERVMRGGMLGIQRMRKSDIHIQRTPAEVSVENNYSGVRQLKEEVDNLRQELSSLKDEVHSGWSEKATAMMGTGVTAATIAAGRAMAQPALQDQLANTATNPEVAVPAIAAGTVSFGVAAGKETINDAYSRVKDRLLGADDDEQGQREGDKGVEESDWFSGLRS